MKVYSLPLTLVLALSACGGSDEASENLAIEGSWQGSCTNYEGGSTDTALILSDELSENKVELHTLRYAGNNCSGNAIGGESAVGQYSLGSEYENDQGIAVTEIVLTLGLSGVDTNYSLIANRQGDDLYLTEASFVEGSAKNKLNLSQSFSSAPSELMIDFSSVLEGKQVITWGYPFATGLGDSAESAEKKIAVSEVLAFQTNSVKNARMPPMGGGLFSYCGPLDPVTGKDNCCSAVFYTTSTGTMGIRRDPADPDC